MVDIGAWHQVRINNTFVVTFSEIENVGKDKVELNNNNHEDAILIHNFYDNNHSK